MKKTALHDVHVALGARMVDFAGWSMPLQYRSGINEEHLAVRDGCGVFDVSHMGQIRITGPDAVSWLQYVALNDAGKLKTGRAHYSMLANDSGGLVDDVYVYRDGESDFLIVTNAANTGAVLEHLQRLSDGRDVVVTDETDAWGLLAVQGPVSLDLLGSLTEVPLKDVRKNATISATIRNHPVRLTRTGYTGEDGFEVFTSQEGLEDVWDAVTAAGAVPVGLGARDTLRLEAGYPLFGNDIHGTTNPMCTPLSWVVKDKDFYGREAMWGQECPHRLVGLRLVQRGVARPGYRVLHEGEPVGEVSSGTISPLTREAIALAWVGEEHAAPGTELAVVIRGQPISAIVSELPFLKR